MIVGGVVFAIVAGVLIFTLPRRSAVIPLLLAAAYTTREPVLELGPATLTVIRLLVVIGLARVVVRGERIAGGLNTMDGLLIAWGGCLIGMSAFHTSDAWVFRIGMVWAELGFYFLCRFFIQDADDVRRVFKFMCVALVPLALLMVHEQATGENLFTLMGATPGINMREGRIRAHGPFAHAILAGTVGAVCVPMAFYLWRKHRMRALVGVGAGVAIVLASASSGPVMTALFVVGALLLWKLRSSLRLIRWAAIAAIVALQILMNDPVYFLMARIDVAGGSKGWHRAQLIRSSLEHLDEWWAVGTDYTRHWMPTGIQANAIHADITNHFLGMGVMGGLPLMLLFVMVLIAAFRGVGRVLLANSGGGSLDQGFLAWTLGAMLFGQVMNFWSISLFDQSVSFFYLMLVCIGAVQVQMAVAARTRSVRAERRRQEPERLTVPTPSTRGAGRLVLPGWPSRPSR
jgi:hypothetical protein